MKAENGKPKVFRPGPRVLTCEERHVADLARTVASLAIPLQNRQNIADFFDRRPHLQSRRVWPAPCLCRGRGSDPMSTRYNNGSHYENHQRAAELHDGAAHAHRVGEEHGKQEHLTGHESSRRALEHSMEPQPHSEVATTGHGTTGHGTAAFGHAEIAALAHELWLSRGCPQGSPEEDWSRAVEELRSRNCAG